MNKACHLDLLRLSLGKLGKIKNSIYALDCKILLKYESIVIARKNAQQFMTAIKTVNFVYEAITRNSEINK